MYRVELIDGRIENLDEDQLQNYSGIIKAFVVDEDLANLDFDDELSKILAEAAA